MPKKKILRLIFILLVVSLILPVYYVVNLASTAIILRNISNRVKVNRPRIEYFTFINLESVIKYKFNSSNYLIYAFANHTKGSSELVRDAHKNLVIENTNIYHVHGTIQNRETKDIYRFESAYLNISEANTLVKMYKDFYIIIIQYILNKYNTFFNNIINALITLLKKYNNKIKIDFILSDDLFNYLLQEYIDNNKNFSTLNTNITTVTPLYINIDNIPENTSYSRIDNLIIECFTPFYILNADSESRHL